MIRRGYALLALSPAVLLMLVAFARTAPEAQMVKGSISGKIVYDGKVPNLGLINMGADPNCVAMHDGAVPNQGLLLGDGKTLGNIFVQIKNPPRGDYATPEEAVVIDQNGCIYEPRVAGVMIGQPLHFKNSDGILHNVHGLPKTNREFNIGMPPTLKEKEITFNKPEPLFPVKCDVHPWMESYIAVMTHPYFAVTGDDGRFRFDDVPPGTYEIEAWHEKLGTRTASITLRSDGDATVNFTFKRPKKK